MKLVLEEKLRKATQKEMDDFVQYRANHVALVQKLGEVGFGMDFSHHDMDKVNAVGKDLEMFALRSAWHKGNLNPSKEDKNEIRKVSARHAKSQKHHPEYWDDSVTIRNYKEDETVIHATRMPKRYIIEMACDWSACALKHNENLFDWYNKVIDNTLFLTDNQKIELISCLFRIKDVVEKYGIQYPNVEYTAESHFMEGRKLDKIGLFANAKGYDVRDFVDYMTKKVEDDWGQVIKRDKSTSDEAIINISPTDTDNDAIERDIGTLAKNLNDDPKVDDWERDNIDKRKFYVSIDDEDKEWDFDMELDIKPNPATGKDETWVPTMECIWGWFLCKKINGQEYPKTIDEVRDIDWMKEIKIDIPFEIPESWMESFLEGSDELLQYLDSSKKYVCFREDKVINTVNLMDYPFLHEFINIIPKKRTDLGLNPDRNHWNPSDIYLVEANKVNPLRSVFVDMANPDSKKFPTLQSIHEYLAELLRTKVAVGISLKTYGIGDSGYANMGEDNRRAYERVKGEVPVFLPSIDLNDLNHIKWTELKLRSKQDERVITFAVNTNALYSTREGANSKEGMCSIRLVKALFEEMGLTVPRVNSLEALMPHISKLGQCSLLTFYVGGEKCSNRATAVAKIGGILNEVEYMYDGKPHDKLYYNVVNYWAFVTTFLLLVQKAFEEKKFLYTMNSLRHGCKKLGPKCAPFVWIG